MNNFEKNNEVSKSKINWDNEIYGNSAKSTDFIEFFKKYHITYFK